MTKSDVTSRKSQKTITQRHYQDNNNENNKQTSDLTVNPLKKDYGNIALLMFLYLLQGLPLGLNGSLPYILSSRKVSYAEQATFSLASWPFSLKLLWAPIVDSIYVKRFGLRKSWLIPIQYLLGITMFLFSDYVYQLLEVNKNREPTTPHSIYILTGIFFMFTFLAATQDIVVDGWALTMLSKENVSWASTCNSVGQTAGWFIGNVVFLTLDSADFCNKYIRPIFGLKSHVYGVVTLQSFMHLMGFVFILSTTIIMLFKKEETEEERHEEERGDATGEHKSLSILDTYKLMWKLLYIAPIRQLVLVLITVKIGFATESMTVLKLIEKDVPREKLSLLAVPLTPLQIILPLIISKYTNGPNALNILVKAIPGRLVMGIVCCFWVYVTPYFKDANNDYPLYYYLICLLINALHSCFVYAMFVSVLCFFARISDKKIGGTYMTFLNTLSNIGNNWPATSALYLASFLTFKQCTPDFDSIELKGDMKNEQNDLGKLYAINKNYCKNDDDASNCTKLGGKCEVTMDAYYIETAVCIVLAILWLFIMRKRIFKLSKLPKSAWSIAKNFKNKKN